MRVSPRASAALRAGRPRSPQTPTASPVIPEKAGIQTVAAKPAIRNQVQTAASGSLLPSWEKARMRVSPRANAALRAGRPRSPQTPTASPVIPARAGITAQQSHLCPFAPTASNSLSQRALATNPQPLSPPPTACRRRAPTAPSRFSQCRNRAAAASPCTCR